jgi:hypothetical protein
MVLPTFIYSAWAGIGLLAVVLVGWNLYRGYNGKGTLIEWRATKLRSTLISAVGIFLLLLNFETVMRHGFSGDPTPQAVLSFVHAKARVLEEMSIRCGKGLEDNRPCSDLRQINGILAFPYVVEGKKFPILQKDQWAPELSAFMDDLKKVTDGANLFVRNPDDQWELLSRDARSKLLLLAAVLLVIALAGSVGEAAYQLRLAKVQGRDI